MHRKQFLRSSLLGASATTLAGAATARPATRGVPTSSVRDFGAKGDGKTDDTAALQRAVDESSAGVLEFPRGDYRVTRTIEVKLASRGPTSLNGMSGVGRITMAGAGPAFRFVGTHQGNAGPDSFKPGVMDKERMPQIVGLEIVGAHPEADGVEFVQVMQPTLSGVFIREVRHAVHLTTRNRNLLLDSCHLYNCRGVGVFFDHVNLHQANIHGCHISYCKGGGIKIVGSEIRNLQVVGNDIEYNYDVTAPESADVWIDVTEGSVREGTIVGNTIQAKVSPGGANVRFVGASDINKVSMFTVTGNHISNQEVNIHLKNCRGMVLEGNSIALSEKRNLLIEGSRHIIVGPHSLDHNPDYGKAVINGITLRDCDGCILNGVLIEGADAGSERDGGAIELLNCRETTVTSCQIFEPKFRGMYVANCRNTRIADCTVMHRAHGDSMIAGLHLVGDCAGSLIQGNIVGKGSRGEIVNEARGATVRDNQAAAR